MSKLKVLIVDDNIHFLKAFQFILMNDHFDKIEQVELAKNGQECLDILEKKTMDIVFMDLDMPVMDGIEATKRIVDQYWGIKVIAVSFHSELNNVKRMIEAGARNYLVKESINKEILEECLRKV